MQTFNKMHASFRVEMLMGKAFQILKVEAKWDVIVAMLLDWLYNIFILVIIR
jgi:hypothetical protein